MEQPLPPASDTSPAPPRSGPGRPRNGTEETRREQAIEAARELFMSNGFAASTMSDVARRAGMSKKTIYTVFESKDALLCAVMERHFQPLSVPLEPDTGQPMEDTLAKLLLRAITFIVSPEEVRFLRLLVADDTRFSQVVPLMEQFGFLHQRSTLAAWMARQAEAGAIQIDDPALAAGMLIGMGLGELHVRLLLGATTTPDPTWLAKRAALAAHGFLHGAMKASPPATLCSTS